MELQVFVASVRRATCLLLQLCDSCASLAPLQQRRDSVFLRHWSEGKRKSVHVCRRGQLTATKDNLLSTLQLTGNAGVGGGHEVEGPQSNELR